MRIVVTGGAGKLGRHLVAELSRGHEVRVFDRVRDEEITDLDQVLGALDGAQAVVHAGGIGGFGRDTPEATFRINTVGTFNVHEAALRLAVRRVVTISSEAVLGWSPGAWVNPIPPDYLPIDEDHPCRPQDYYGLSKQATEAVALGYWRRSGMETVVLRPPMIVSPEELEALRRSGGQTPARFAMYHYVDARDVATACRAAIERPLPGGTVLFVGSGESTVVEPLATLYPRLMPAIGDKAKGLTGIQGPVATARARTALGWTPRHSWRKPEP
jgi:nucleoside-diphosphate-sugar epimerase